MSELPLDPTGAQKRELLDAVGERLLAFLESIGAQPAHSNSNGAEALGWFDEPIPDRGAPIDELLELLFDRAIPCALNTASPGYLAYVPGGGLFTSALGDLIASAVNRYAGVWVAAPGAVELETRVVRWLTELMGMPRGALGVLTTGGSISNLLAFVAAREEHLGDEISRGVVYVSTETHHSVTKAARVAGIRPAQIREIPVDASLRVRMDALAEAVAADRAAGRVPFFVCGNAGTVNTGAVDPLGDLAELAEREELWFHVDGAYGAAFRLVPECHETLRGIERADSIAFDPHKGLFLAYGTGALLVKRPARLRAAFESGAAYMPDFQDGETRVDFCELSPELSREWRGLRLWLALKLHGVDAFREALAERRAFALRLAEALSGEPGVELIAPPALSLFAFRRRHRGATLEQENERNRALLERINADGRIYMTGTSVGGAFVLRICVLHMRTDAARIDATLEIIRAALAED